MNVVTSARECFRIAYGLLRACGSFQSALRNLERNGREDLFAFLDAADRALSVRPERVRS